MRSEDISLSDNKPHKKPHVCLVSENRATYGLITGSDQGVMGGAELQQVLIAESLVRLGYKTTFVISDFGQPDSVVTDRGIVLVKGRKDPDAQSATARIQGLLKLFGVLRRIDADVYYQRTAYGLTGLLALFCRIVRKSFVFSVASNSDLDIPLGQRTRSFGLKLCHFGVTHADTVVVQSQDQMKMLKERFGLDGVLIPSAYEEPNEESPRDTVNVLWVGSFRSCRRPEMFLELAKQLPKYEFVMIGGPNPSEPSVFENISVEARGVPNLKVLGHVPYNDVGMHFADAAVFVNTSSIEGFPNTFLQAWSRGVPVVSTFDADCLIATHGLGKVCATVDELAAAVHCIMSDEELHWSMSRHVIEYVKTHHGLDVVGAGYDQLFERCIHSDRRRL